VRLENESVLLNIYNEELLAIDNVLALDESNLIVDTRNSFHKCIDLKLQNNAICSDALISYVLVKMIVRCNNNYLTNYNITKDYKLAYYVSIGYVPRVGFWMSHFAKENLSKGNANDIDAQFLMLQKLYNWGLGQQNVVAFVEHVRLVKLNNANLMNKIPFYLNIVELMKAKITHEVSLAHEVSLVARKSKSDYYASMIAVSNNKRIYYQAPKPKSTQKRSRDHNEYSNVDNNDHNDETNSLISEASHESMYLYFLLWLVLNNQICI